MKIGFVTFCTKNYKDIMDNLVNSVIEFSKYNITIYSINFDYTYNSDRVTVKRIDLSDLSYYNICKMKIFSTIDCGFDVGLILDGDMIVTNLIDNIFDENLEKVQNSKFPLFAKHPHNPFERRDYKNVLKYYTNKTPKMNWVYASYLFSKENIWFLEKVYSMMESPKTKVGEDELIINALLTEYEVDYDIGYNYLPNALDDMIDLFFGRKEDTIENNPYLQCECPVKYYIFHGHLCKNVNESKKLIEEIKNL